MRGEAYAAVPHECPERRTKDCVLSFFECNGLDGDRDGSAHGLGDLLEEPDRKERANLSLKTFNVLPQVSIFFPESHKLFGDVRQGAIDKFVESARQLRRF